MDKYVLNFFLSFSVATLISLSGQAQVCSPQTVQTRAIPEWNQSHFIPNNLPSIVPLTTFAVPNSVEVKMLTPDLICHEQGRLRSKGPVAVCYDQVQGDLQDTFANGFCHRPQSLYLYSESTTTAFTVPSMKMYLDSQKAHQQSELFMKASFIPVGWEGGLFSSKSCLQYRYQIPACE